MTVRDASVLPVLIVGAGPAGLATAAAVRARGIPYRLLERGDSLGFAWENAYDSLTLHTGRGMSALPGLAFPKGTPTFPTRAQFCEYLHEYGRRNDLRVETNRPVRAASRVATGWLVQAGSESIHTRDLVMATGIMANPQVPQLAGREQFPGRVMHSVEYRRPGDLAGQRVLVVGVGNSGGEIGSELAHAGATVTVAVRSGTSVVPRDIAGIPVQYIVQWLLRLPRRMQRPVIQGIMRVVTLVRGGPVLPPSTRPLFDGIPLIGFHLVDAIRAGLVRVKTAGVERFTVDGVRFADGAEESFDAVVLATGFAPALDALGTLVRKDAKGFALRSDRVTSADHPHLYFVGHNYDVTGGLANISRDSLIVAAKIAERQGAGGPGLGGGGRG